MGAGSRWNRRALRGERWGRSGAVPPSPPRPSRRRAVPYPARRAAHSSHVSTSLRSAGHDGSAGVR